jgi:hypothetical protein
VGVSIFKGGFEMVIVGKHISDITLNSLEYLLDDDGKAMEFINEGAAKAFLKEKGLSDDDIYRLVFETVSASNMTKEVFMDAKASINKIEDFAAYLEAKAERKI